MKWSGEGSTTVNNASTFIYKKNLGFTLWDFQINRDKIIQQKVLRQWPAI